jgi:c-di-GMP-binding flagellar brake protein YcgR
MSNITTTLQLNPGGSEMLEERRRFTRVPFDVIADLEVNGETFHTETIEDLSVGGCRLPIKTDLCIGADCQVTIFLTGSQEEIRVEMVGTIVRYDSESVSVKFTSVDPESEAHLQRIVMYNAQDPAKVEKEIQDNEDIA